MHEAVLFDVHESRILDSARVESYQGLNNMGFPDSPAVVPDAYGFAITLDKKVARRLFLEGGYADIDVSDNVRAQSVISSIIGLDVNGDQYGVGKRIFVRPNVKLTPYLEASCFYTKQLPLTLVASTRASGTSRPSMPG